MALTLSTTSTWFRAAAEHLAHWGRLWLKDLLALVPTAQRDRWDRSLGLRGPLVIVADAREVYWGVDGSEQSLSPEMIRDRTRMRVLALRIDDAHILQRKLELPTAAVARLDTAIAMNLSTWTPFAAAEVYAAAQSMEQARRGSTVTTTIELRCIPRALVDDRIAVLRTRGLDPDSIELGDARFRISRATRKRVYIRRRRWLLTGLVLLLLCQGIVAHLIVSSRQNDEIELLETARARMVTTLRRQRDTEKQALARRERSFRIASKMDEKYSVSRALRLLASDLPEDAVIREFELARDRSEGNVVILGSAGLDVAATLSKSGFYRVKDLSVRSANDAERKVFATGFTVVPWIQSDRSAGR